MTLNIEYENIENKLDIDYKEIIKNTINEVIEYEGCPYETEINVILTDNENIQEINNEFRNINKPTDVLSFPMIEYKKPSDFSELEKENDCFNPETGELVVGDIVISVDKVYEQAENYGHTIVRELAFLVAHSMLHLFGYDHIDEQERIVMENKQREILNNIGITR